MYTTNFLSYENSVHLSSALTTCSGSCPTVSHDSNVSTTCSQRHGIYIKYNTLVLTKPHTCRRIHENAINCLAPTRRPEDQHVTVSASSD